MNNNSIMLNYTRYTLHLDNELTNTAAGILYSIKGCEVLQVSYEAIEAGQTQEDNAKTFFGLIDFRIVNNHISLERILEILNQELLTSFELKDQ
ncbi:hypothetical protein [Paenibacillus sp. JDR-2]|uniref:hypothetical protein n=1 Tax=Paenibacillus sp. (strain JDR-2) TaxID=324057 RepID=UPI0001667983|nr:hypothetical protein [Paenibacillus sp. JDR-2]ACT02294.1 hypothetical protein Pjdr2_3662 [Paenibacillus sp. JDR-2]